MMGFSEPAIYNLPEPAIYNAPIWAGSEPAAGIALGAEGCDGSTTR